jgi:hypothetical protein
MSTFEPQFSHNVSIDSSVEEMCKGQDHAYHGIFIDEDTGETGKWGMITDGHGSNTCINYLRSIPQIDMNKVMGNASPAEALFKMVNRFAEIWSREVSGATMCLVKIYRDRVVCINVGDSQAAVYKNGELAFITETHDSFNEKEIARLNKENPNIDFYVSQSIEITTDGKMHSVPSRYVIHNTNITLALTQALGHCGITGCAPDTTTIPYGPEDTVRIVIGSDGFWDMVVQKDAAEVLSFGDKSSDELLKFSVDRWLQPWEMCRDREAGKFETGSFRKEECDDVGVLKIDIVPCFESVYTDEHLNSHTSCAF